MAAFPSVSSGAVLSLARPTWLEYQYTVYMNHISLLYFSQNSSEMVLLSQQEIFQFRTSGNGAGVV